MKTQNKGQVTEAIIFARVATRSINDRSKSIYAQLEKLDAYCKQEGFSIVSKISGVCSGHKRGMLSYLLEVIKGRKNKVIVCSDKMDRLSRDVSSKELNTLYDLATQGKVELHFVSEDQIIKSDMNAGDKFAFNMKSGLSKYYSDAISDNVKRALEQKRQNGEWANKAPFGYLNAKDKDGKSTILVDKEKAEVAKFIFKLHSKEITLKDILPKLREKYPNNSFEITRGMVYRIIRNKDFYSGYINHDGKKYPHKYERILTIKK